ncbi:trypsin-like peptidase domain-containing protein [Romeria aff. gracilis LEGE 07310]|uniref:Trypsin-like peptidase domain-containing protein n=1 Tax=Vasconcelosia minhoensis LEGE 07310 TaxID=915328 RepID=A0A8J7DB84_9CYAN|nr:trypsin-like peptidase domain-containing protein [Romeria gracilis]MBE9076013.1 trypsin-like peptidase domain-containing protein [Romeria aff. gracilis LEGE 07310]
MTRLLIIRCVAAIGLCLGCLLGWMPAALAAEPNFVTSAVEAAEPAVVQINVSRGLGGNVPRFFNPFGGPRSAPPGGMMQGIGSGFVIDERGYVLTNAHVVANADQVMVLFPDGQFLEGSVLGKDPVTDVAVVQVRSDINLPVVQVGDSDELQRGQWAIAIGNPLGLQETVTVGVISATERSSSAIGVPDRRVGFIQTDAAINPGNSGGPLLNQQGEVIGVNTAIIGGTQGLGFAIPINTARRIAEQLIAGKPVEHPYIGVQMLTLNPAIQQQISRMSRLNISIEAQTGVLVMEVIRNSPAARAGLRPGDVIQAIAQQPVTKAEKIQQILDQSGVGNPLLIKLMRQDQAVEVTVRPEQLPAQRG